jgi:hypothetical protein
LPHFFIPKGSENDFTNTAAGETKMKKNSESQILLWKLPRRREKAFQDCQICLRRFGEVSFDVILGLLPRAFLGQAESIPTKALKTIQIRIKSHLLKRKVSLE